MKNRYPPLVRDAVGKPLCRGCGNPVPRRRQTWCSYECYWKYCPQCVLINVRKRDKGICQICQKQTRGADPDTIVKLGGRGHWNPIWKDLPCAEFDHIIPFSEGGKTILENMRTLCKPCHKQRTSEWHKSRKLAAPKKAEHFQPIPLDSTSPA